MVARPTSAPSKLLTRSRGAAVGFLADSISAIFAMLLLTTMSFAFALTVAAMCPAAGAVVGATVGRALAVRPTLLRVIAVTTLADVIGLVLSLPALLFQDTSMDLELLVGSGLVFAVPAYFLLAIPGVVLGVAIARLQP